MQSIPEVAIITGLYNSSKYLNSYFKMLEMQTFRGYEVILVDDGSTDDTEALVKDYSKNNGRIKYYKKLPEGFPSRSRSFGLKYANALFVAFCDHDDFWAPQKLEFQVEAMKQHQDIAICYTDRIMWNSLTLPEKFEKFENKMRFESPQNTLYKGCKITFSSFMSRADWVKKIDFHPELKGVDDYYLYLNLIELGKICKIDLPLTYYYFHQNNLSHESNIFVQGLKKIVELSKSSNLNPLSVNAVDAQAKKSLAVSLLQENKFESFKLLLESLYLYFSFATFKRLMFLLLIWSLPKNTTRKILAYFKKEKFANPELSDLFKFKKR